MAKAYTDINQSKMLAEILSPESADMWFGCIGESMTMCHVGNYLLELQCRQDIDYRKTQPKIICPCWSLAALLEIINECCRYGVRLKFLRSTFDGFGNVLKNVWCITTDTSKTEPFIDVVYADNALDAAVNIVLKLHEQKLI